MLLPQLLCCPFRIPVPGFCTCPAKTRTHHQAHLPPPNTARSRHRTSITHKPPQAHKQPHQAHRFRLPLCLLSVLRSPAAPHDRRNRHDRRTARSTARSHDRTAPRSHSFPPINRTALAVPAFHALLRVSPRTPHKTRNKFANKFAQTNSAEKHQPTPSVLLCDAQISTKHFEFQALRSRYYCHPQSPLHWRASPPSTAPVL